VSDIILGFITVIAPVIAYHVGWMHGIRAAINKDKP
jgi:hypothetical protein